MRHEVRTLSVLALTLALLPSGAALALDDPEEEYPRESEEFIELPQDADYYDAFDVPGCGSTLTIESGDVREVEYQYTVSDDGSDRFSVRGDQTIDITRQSDGAELDELDISGPGYQETSADGLTQVNGFYGSTFYYSADEADQAAYAAAGLPEVFYYTEGYFKETLRLAVDSGEVVAATVDVNDVKDAVDVCDLLDEADDEDD